VIVSMPTLAGTFGTEYVNETFLSASVMQLAGLPVPVAPAFWPPTVNVTRYPPTNPGGPSSVAVTRVPRDGLADRPQTPAGALGRPLPYDCRDCTDGAAAHRRCCDCLS
jgi:hypothetical protein